MSKRNYKDLVNTYNYLPITDPKAYKSCRLYLTDYEKVFDLAMEISPDHKLDGLFYDITDIALKAGIIIGYEAGHAAGRDPRHQDNENGKSRVQARQNAYKK